MKYPANVIPPELRALPQWVGWKYEETADGKVTKRPLRILDKKKAKTNVPKDWTTFENAHNRLEKSSALNGIGFVFTNTNDLCGIDLDHCLDPQTGELSPFARDVVERMNSYTEVSPSGRGVKIFLRNSKPLPGRRITEIECYCEGRYFTVTGQVFRNYTLIYDRTEEFNELWTEKFGPDANSKSSSDTIKSGNWSEILSTLNVPDDDEAILTMAMKPPKGNKFTRLWTGVKTDFNHDHSRCDGSMCAKLAYWCGPDPLRIDRLFRRSALMRAKWDEKHSSVGLTYGELQVANAIDFQQRGSGFCHWYSDLKQLKQQSHTVAAPQKVELSKPAKLTKNLSMNIDAEVFFHAKAQCMKRKMKWRDFIQNLLDNC